MTSGGACTSSVTSKGAIVVLVFVEAVRVVRSKVRVRLLSNASTRTCCILYRNCSTFSMFESEQAKVVAQYKGKQSNAEEQQQSERNGEAKIASI